MTDDVLNAYKRLLNEQASLMRDYRKLLAESESDERLAIILKKYPLFFPRVIVEHRCPLTQDNRLYASFLPDPTKPRDGHRHLQEFTNGASNLVIVDPYLFPKTIQRTKEPNAKFQDRQQKNRQAHGARFFDSISIEGITHIHVVVDRDKLDSKLYNNVHKKLDKCSIQMTKVETDKIHDRIWIKNISGGKIGCSAKVVGTSLNGLGKKAAFILDLPQEDLNGIIKFMGQHSLLGPLQHHARHFA